MQAGGGAASHTQTQNTLNTHTHSGEAHRCSTEGIPGVHLSICPQSGGQDPLLDSVGVAQHFLYISTGGQKPPEDAPPTGAYPSLLFTFVTSQSHNSTAMKVLNILSQPQWSSINLSSSLGSLPPLSLYQQY